MKAKSHKQHHSIGQKNTMAVVYGFCLLFSFFIYSCTSDEELISSPIIPGPVCLQDECWDQSIYACRDSTMIDLFTRSDDGWTGGDATYSIALPDDRTLWLFGDSFIGQVNSNRTRSSLRLINNTLVVQDGDNFDTFHGGPKSNPTAFAIPPDGTSWYWPTHGFADEDTLYVFFHAFATGGGGMWDFFRTGVDLLKMNPNTLEIFSNDRIPINQEISYGADVLVDEDYVYVYGVLSTGLNKFAYVARANSRLEFPWEFYTGAEWSLDETQIKPMFNDVSEQFSVFKESDKYYLLTQHHIFGTEIYLYTSDTPVGPWGNKKIVYCTPETEGDIFTYNAFAHPQFTEDEELLISYNINSFDFNDLAKSADNYRPYFARISGWK